MRKNANHGSTQFYLLIAIVLGVITFFEFAFVEWQGLLFNNDGLILWSLYILSIVKFFLVVMFFMHLYGDHKLLTQLFTAGMVIGSVTVAIMLMLFTADNMNRYRVVQPVSAHGEAAEHGGGHGDAHGPVEIPVRSLAETLARPAPKSQQYALAPREGLDAGSLNLPSISLPAIDQGVLPAGNSSMEPEIMETVVAAVTTESVANEPVTTEPVVQEVQVVETVTTEVTPVTVTTTAPTVEAEAVTTTTTTTTEVVTTDATASDDLMALRAQVEALRLELEAMENALPAEAATTITAPVVTETVTTTVTQAADTHSSAQTAAIATTAAVTVGAAATAAVENISANTTPAVVTEATTETAEVETATEATTETVSTEAVTEAPVETVSVSFDTELGNSTYMNCMACHQMTGEGIPGAFPPLKGHMPALYNAEGGRDYLIQVVLYGLQGEIVIDGMTYNGLMTPWNSLDDDSVAAVLNHELTSWGNDAMLNDFSPITAEEVAVQRATPLTAQDVYANRVVE